MTDTRASAHRSTSAALLGCLLLSGCGNDDARWEAAQQASTQEGSVAVSEAALPGSTFNRFFPEQGDGIDIVFEQEKDGFAQASLHREGERIAMLSISDTRNNPEARDKFEAAETEVGGYPVVDRENTTSLLVADRFQVQVQSEGEAVTAADRHAWLERFDLGGLANAF